MFKKLGWVEYVLELQNTSSKKLTITGISDNNTSSYIAYSYDDPPYFRIDEGAGGRRGFLTTKPAA